MRLAVLTTGSVRRRYFVERLQQRFAVAKVMIEIRDPPPPIPTDHPLDTARNERESAHWYNGSPPRFDDIAATERHETLNDPAAVASLRALKPEVVLVYGTGPLGAEVLDCCRDGILNFHNGDPEEYRGLDCHLWPIYHRDFDALQMTLHRIEPELDTGAIVDRRPVPLSRGMPLADLRRAACDLSVGMALSALERFQESGGFDAMRQSRKGRYYSYMPAVLKDICTRNFERHTAAL